jgi:hypothetical protein
MMLGEISPHHNYENQSSSETLPSYTQLSYNHNIERYEFFTSIFVYILYLIAVPFNQNNNDIK